MIYIVNGHPGSGKTTFEKMVKKLMGQKNCGILSIIDPIKFAALILGWEGEKTPEGRKFLSDLKDLATQYNNFPIRDVIQQARKAMHDANEHDCLFIDCREPKEVEILCKELNAKSVFIKRNIPDQQFSNHADECVSDYNYDIIIHNAGSISDLWETADQFIKDEGLTYSTDPVEPTLFEATDGAFI